MHHRKVPAVDARYWAAIMLASVFGANMGDFVSRTLHMGHLQGLPYIAAVFALIIGAARLSPGAWEGWYWLAIVTLRTAATNLADLATHDGALGTLPVCAVLLVLLAAALLARRGLASDPIAAGVPRTDAGYWLAMLIAGTFGTALGDGLADAIGLATAAVLSCLAVGVALGLRKRPVFGLLAAYWVAICAIRTAGTNVGDLLAHGLGLTISTTLSGVALLVLLLVWRERRVPGGVPA